MATRSTPAKKVTKTRTSGLRRGAPNLLDPDRVETLLTAIRLGNPLKTCAQYAGISQETVRQWRIRGEEALKVAPGRRSQSDRAYADFVGRLDKALAEANVFAQRSVHTLMTKKIEDSTSPEQQRVILSAAQFHLTHRDPEGYNTRQRMELTGTDGGPIDIEASADKAWKQLQEMFGRVVNE